MAKLIEDLPEWSEAGVWRHAPWVLGYVIILTIIFILAYAAFK